MLGHVQIRYRPADVQLHVESDQRSPIVWRDLNAGRPRGRGLGEDAFEAEMIHVALKHIDGPMLDEWIKRRKFTLRFAIGEQRLPAILANKGFEREAVVDFFRKHLFDERKLEIGQIAKEALRASEVVAIVGIDAQQDIRTSVSANRFQDSTSRA